MTQILTPANAYKFSELTDAQKDKVRTDFGLGDYVGYFTSVKTGTDHAINVQTLKVGKVNIFVNDDIIENGDTITDIDANSYDVVLEGCSYIPANWKCNVQISGTDAIVSRHAAFKDIKEPPAWNSLEPL